MRMLPRTWLEENPPVFNLGQLVLSGEKLGIVLGLTPLYPEEGPEKWLYAVVLEDREHFFHFHASDLAPAIKESESATTV